MKMKKTVALFAAAAMACSLFTGCGSDGGSGDGSLAGSGEVSTESGNGGNGGSAVDGSLSGVQISFLNSKGEIQSGLEEMADAFEQETGIKVDIMACGAGEVPYTKITSAYNSGTAPTMAMLDTTDIIALAEEYAIDLSEEKWTAEAEAQLTKVNGKVYSFPFCVEGRGLVYNKKAIEDTLGGSFDPNSINSYDSLKKLLEDLRAGGMENPVVISKEDWSLGAHQLGYIYDTYDGTTAGSGQVMEQLKSGALDPAEYARFNEFVDTLDLLLEYNINKKDPLGALYEQDPIFLADGEAAIWANGSWAWPNILDAGAESTDEYGFIPFVLGNDTSDFANTGIQASASKQVMLDKVQASEQEIAAARAFLDWIVYNENGQKMLVENCAVIPACVNNHFDPVDPLGMDIKERMAAGKTYSSSFIAPSDHWSVMGAAMQKYIQGSSSRVELAQSLKDYWTAQN